MNWARTARLAGAAAAMGLVTAACSGGGGGGSSPKSATSVATASTQAPENPAPTGSGGGGDVPTAPGLPGTARAVFTLNGPTDAAHVRAANALITMRLGETGVHGATVQVTPDGHGLVVNAPAADAPALRTLASPASVQFRPVLAAATPGGGQVTGGVPDTMTSAYSSLTCTGAYPATAAADQPQLACGVSGEVVTKYALGPSDLSGSAIKSALASQDPTSPGQWTVNISLDAHGSAVFSSVTAQLMQLSPPQNELAVTLDATVLTAPSISMAITGGQLQISGIDANRAQALADALTAASQPNQLSLSSVETFS